MSLESEAVTIYIYILEISNCFMAGYIYIYIRN